MPKIQSSIHKTRYCYDYFILLKDILLDFRKVGYKTVIRYRGETTRPWREGQGPGLHVLTPLFVALYLGSLWERGPPCRKLADFTLLNLNDGFHPPEEVVVGEQPRRLLAARLWCGNNRAAPPLLMPRLPWARRRVSPQKSLGCCRSSVRSSHDSTSFRHTCFCLFVICILSL